MEFVNLLGFPGGSAGEESACYAGGLGSIPGLGRFPREGTSYLLQYSGLKNSMDYIVHGLQRIGHNWVSFTFTLSIYYKMLHSTTLWYTTCISAVCFSKITQNLRWYSSVQVWLSIKHLQFTHPYDKLLTRVRVGLPRSQDSFTNQMKSIFN